MVNSKEVSRLASIISGYRNGELPVALDEKHVLRWLNQFSEENRDIILKETVHILSDWYFDIDSINEFLLEVYDHVKNKYGGELVDVGFANEQEQGQSQKRLVKVMTDLIKPQELPERSEKTKHLIYIDDGIYSGQHAKKDIERMLQNDIENSIESVDVYVLIGFSNGLYYVNSILEQLCREKGIDFSVNRWKELTNIKTVQPIDNGETYYSNQDVLWPIESSRTGSLDVKARVEEISGRKIHYCCRKIHQNYSSRIFTGETNRRIIENEFLNKGNDILTDETLKKGIYPLGYSSYPSLGFGSFCATQFNISNTCPVVLWWGNVVKDDSPLDHWYPLLPRRTNE